MRTLLVALAVAMCVPALAGTPEPGFTDTAYVAGLSGPTAVAFMPDGRMLVTEKGGALKLRAPGGSTSTLVTIPVCTDSEMGLLGIALDPAFGTNGFIYLYRTKAGAGGCGTATGRFNQVVRVTMVSDTVSIGSLAELLTGIPTDAGNHDGGVLRIGPDGKLWVGAGDTGLGDNQGGPGTSTNPYSQDLGSLAGKVLRLNLNGTAPADNPFVGVGGARPEIYARGFRNPFRMSFDPNGNRLWLADVGDGAIEEIDIVTAGGNYSWPYCEGTSPAACEHPGDIDPVFTYPHSGGTSLGTCVIGGAFAGAAFGAFAGQYVFGDCTSSDVYRAALNPARDDISGTPVLVSSAAGTPSDFVTGPDGAIYYSAFSGDVRRLAASASAQDSLLTGRMLNMRRSPTNTSSRGLRASSGDTSIDLGAGNGSSDDPTSAGGSLRVQSSAEGFDDTYPMPAGFWTLIGPGAGKGYRYKDRDQVNGPITAATVRNGRLLSVSGKGPGLGHTLATDPAPVNLVLSTGTKRYCLSFGGTTRFTPTRMFTGRNAPAPGACPP